VLAVCPIDAGERCELFLHGASSRRIVGRDMQRRTQRSRHGEPVARLSLSVRCGHRHTRRPERELVSITCSGLKIRRRRVHVPRPILAISAGMESVDGSPMSGLNADVVLACAGTTRVKPWSLGRRADTP
jgi:hypothetical protein